MSRAAPPIAPSVPPNWRVRALNGREDRPAAWRAALAAWLLTGPDPETEPLVVLVFPQNVAERLEPPLRRHNALRSAPLAAEDLTDTEALVHLKVRASWDPCARCADPDGPVLRGRRSPDRLSGARFGYAGELCGPCYRSLALWADGTPPAGTFERTWSPCALCAEPDGPWRVGRSQPERHDGKRYGVRGYLCRRCADRLYRRELRARHRKR